MKLREKKYPQSRVAEGEFFAAMPLPIEWSFGSELHEDTLLNNLIVEVELHKTLTYGLSC